MTLRSNGSYIGPRPAGPTNGYGGVASGIWDLRTAERQKRAAAWPAPFSDPTNITGLQLWLDASDSSTLYDATTGGSLVAADGAVARWQDKSGNGRHATQSTSGNRPIRKASVQNGKDAIRFDGSNDSLSIASSTAMFNFVHQSGSTIFVVTKPSQSSDPNQLDVLLSNELSNAGSSNTGFSIAFDDRAAASRNNGLLLFASNRSADNGDWRYAYVVSGSFQASNAFSLLTFRGDMTQSTGADRGATRINGGNPLSVSPFFGNDGSINSGNATYDLNIGTAGEGSGFFSDCDMAEIIIYNSALSDIDRAAVESYLLAKWAIT